MPAQLTLYYPWQPAQIVMVSPASEQMIGRGEDCNVRLHDPSVSRHHATLRCRPEGWQLRDLDSKNGTWCSGELVQQWRSLTASAPLQFGTLPARFDALTDHDWQQQQWLQQRRQQRAEQCQAQWLRSATDTDLLQQIVADLLQLAEAERGFVVLADGRGQWRQHALGYADAALAETVFAGSYGAVALAFQRRRPVVVCDLARQPELAQRPSVRQQGLRALVCLPLLINGQLLGALYADSRVPGTQYTELDIAILESLADHAALTLHAQQLACQLQHVQWQLLTQPDNALPHWPHWPHWPQ